MKTQKTWLGIGIIFILAVCAYLGLTGEYKNVVSALGQMNKWWLIAGLSLIGLYWLIEAFTLNVLVNNLHEKTNFKSLMKVSMIGQFFSGLTPFASGGQPAQLVLLNKNKVPVGIGSSILMSKFVVYQSVLVIYSGILLILKSNMFYAKVNNLFGLVILGFGVNLIVITVLLFISFAKGSNKNIATGLIHFLHKIKVIKHKEKHIENIEEHINEFHTQVDVMRGHSRLIIKIVILTVLQLTSYFLVPYCLYKGFGLDGVSVINIIAATAFVLMVTSFVPLPGGSGGAEGGFYMIFGMFFLPHLIIPAVLIWRVMTYYLWMAIGGIWMLGSQMKMIRSTS